MLEWIQTTFPIVGFMPHGMCYLWDPTLLGMHVISDSMIFLSYSSIPVSLVAFVRKRRDLPFNWIFLMFGLFIVACGLTHLLATVTVWYPAYWVSGSFKIVAAAISVITAVALFPLLPKALAIPSPTMLREANQELEIQIAERQRTELELKEKNLKLKESLENLRNAQEQLIQSEKMASLGQLVAGVAHEINNPMAAIQSSASTIENHLKVALAKLSKIFQILSEEEQSVFFMLLEQSFISKTVLSVKEKRNSRKKMMAELEKLGFENSRGIADIFGNLGVMENPENYMILLKHPERPFILDMVYRLSNIYINNQNIIIASEKARKIVYALKSFARFDHSGELVETDLSENIEMILSLYHNQLKHGCEVIRDYQKTPIIFCFPDALGQVWTNLIHNAIQAMNYQGTLTIRIDLEGEEVVVSISDTGPGIPDEIKEKIFTPFFTTKRPGEGSGLGLDIVNKIVESHFGKIEIESEMGQGTTFLIRLPKNLHPSNKVPSNKE